MTDPFTHSSKASKASSNIDFSDIPNAWPSEDKTRSVEGDQASHPTSTEAPLDGANISESAAAKMPQSKGDDLGDISTTQKMDINDDEKHEDEIDLKEDCESNSKAASHHEQSIKKRMFKVEQKLHSVNLGDRERTWIWASPFITEVAELMSDHLEITKGKVFESAIIMFYRNCFSDHAKLSDIGLMLDHATLQNQELSIEISALEDLAILAMQAEASPLNQQPPE